MQKTKKIGFFIMLACTLSALCCTPNQRPDLNPPGQIEPVIFCNVQGVNFAEKCIEQYPEILFLANADVRKTEEGQAVQGSYSEQLFGAKFIEFDRTIMTLHCLKLIINGSEAAYLEFTDKQPADTKLSRESFKRLHQQADAIQTFTYTLSKQEMAQAMEAALVLGDIGKSEKARDLFRPYGAQAPDHDDFHEEVMAILKDHPDLCPTFDKLPPAAKSLLCKTANLAHYGHITHIEGGPGMFSKLRESYASVSDAERAFDFFVHTCDVAGALGHLNNQSSLVYTEPSHNAMQAVFKACSVFLDSTKTEIDAYNAYLATRATWLGLDSRDLTARVITRMGAMLRLFTPEDGETLKNAFSQLPIEEQNRIINELDTKEGEDLARTPTYMPAVLVNLSSNPILGDKREERLAQAVILGLPFLARVLEQHKQSLLEKTANPNVPLNFNTIAGIAKAAPQRLSGEFRIDNDGNVLLD